MVLVRDDDDKASNDNDDNYDNNDGKLVIVIAITTEINKFPTRRIRIRKINNNNNSRHTPLHLKSRATPRTLYSIPTTHKLLLLMRRLVATLACCCSGSSLRPPWRTSSAPDIT